VWTSSIWEHARKSSSIDNGKQKANDKSDKESDGGSLKRDPYPTNRCQLRREGVVDHPRSSEPRQKRQTNPDDQISEKQTCHQNILDCIPHGVVERPNINTRPIGCL